MCSEWLKAETVKRVKQNRNMHKSSFFKKKLLMNVIISKNFAVNRKKFTIKMKH